ncbi:MAG: aromatic ring-hydroxylating dioxygenase subunit alpha [Sphingobium sp.]
MNYVRNAWYVACWSHELIEGKPFGARILNESIVLWRSDDRISALEDRCVHRLAPLSLGRCEGVNLRCGYHGLLFDREGRVVEIPGQDRIPDIATVRPYPVIERHGWVWLWMGDFPADEGRLPPLLGLNHPDFQTDCGTLDYAAEARLINDNLLDLSHVSYLHTGSFGMSESWARNPPQVTKHHQMVRSERWFKGEGELGKQAGINAVDTYFRYDFFVPGVLEMAHWTFPTGTADRFGGEQPPLNARAETFTSQAVTPVTAKTARYFFVMGIHNSLGRPPDMSIAAGAFKEDKDMIEAQQRNIDDSPDQAMMPIAGDKGATLYNRMLNQMVRAERESA